MKKLVVFIAISIFLLSFTVATGITSQAIEKLSDNNSTNESSNLPSTNNEQNNSAIDSSARDRIRGRINNKLTDEQINKIFTKRNRLRKDITKEECPEKCTCEGSVTKCQLENGTREIIITAGKSGNIIIQVEGINGTTQITLYKSEDGKIYAVNKNNETIRIKLFPDQLRERMRERFARHFENENITLNENGTYDYNGEKNVTLFFFFHMKEKIKAEINSETGEIKNIKNPWWAFMAKDEGQPIVGASCGTVTPGENDNCCKNKSYDFWNATASECQFNSD
jgi:hypothetical protein